MRAIVQYFRIQAKKTKPKCETDDCFSEQLPYFYIPPISYPSVALLHQPTPCLLNISKIPGRINILNEFRIDIEHHLVRK